MKNSLVLAALFLCLALPPKIADAAAWLQEKGNFQYISTFSYYAADEFFDDDGHAQPSSYYAKLENNRYLEYGFAENLTLGTSLRLTHQQVDDNAVLEQYLSGNAVARDFSHGSTSIDLFYRQQLAAKDNWLISFQPLIQLPELYSHDGKHYYIDEDSYALEMRGLFGYGYQHDNSNVPPSKAHLALPFAKQWHFFNGEIAYRKRGKSRPTTQDELKLDTSFGIRAHDNLLVLLQNFTTIGVEHLDDMADTAHSKLQLSTVYRHTDNRGLQLSFYEDIWGRNSGKGKGFMIGIWSGF